MTLQVGKGSNLKAPMEIDSAHAEYPANGARLYTVKSNSERYHFLYRKWGGNTQIARIINKYFYIQIMRFQHLFFL